MRFIRDSRRVTVPGAGSTVDVVMDAQDKPFRELTILAAPVTSRVPGDGLPAAARDYSVEIFFGPTSQGGATARTDDNQFLALDPGDGQRIYPANNHTSYLHARPRGKSLGFPITARLINNLLASSQPTNITGVVITAVDPATTVGAGTMTFTAIGTLLDWQAPGAGAPGAAQNVGAGGNFTLAGGDGTTIDVTVTALSLPVGDESDSIDITGDSLEIDIEFLALGIELG